MRPLSRRRLVLATALPLSSLALPALIRPAAAAEITGKVGTNLPATHPLNLRLGEAIERIRAATDGRVALQLFPNSQLGADTDMLAQARSGALEYLSLSGLILSTLVPVAALNGLGFAFKDYDQVWPAMDGPLGGLIRAEIAKRGLHAFPAIFDNGYRQVTTSARPVRGPEDLRGLKMRVPVSPLWTSLFRAFGSAPASINFNETYSALQTRIVDGQENPLAIIETAKLYEVQKYCSLTNHMWDGFWLLSARRVQDRLPPGIQEVIAREFDRAAREERADVARLNAELRGKLATAGLTFNDTEAAPFREALRQAGFYAEWRQKFGEEAWAALEAAVGRLA